MNQTRVGLADGQDYIGAEQILEEIEGIRNEAEFRIKQAMRIKHAK